MILHIYWHTLILLGEHFGVLFGSQGVLAGPFWLPKVDFVGAEGPCWTAGGSTGTNDAKTSLPPPHFGIILASKLTQKSELKFD